QETLAILKTLATRIETPIDDMHGYPSAASAGLFDAHVPFDQPPNLALGVAALHHSRDELTVLLLGVAVLLRTERDHRQQVLDLREYPLFDHFANFFVAGPARVLAAILRPRPQREFYHFVAEILGVGDAGRLFDLGQFLVEQFAIEQLSGVGILEILVFDPGVGIVDVTVEQVLAVVRIGFQIRLLYLVADEFGITRHQIGLDEFQIALFDFLRQLLPADRLLQRVHQMHGIGAELGGVVIEGRGQDLERKARRSAVHALVDAGGILVFLHAAGLRIGLLQAFAVIHPHLGKQRRVLVLAQPRHYREARQRLERRRRARRGRKLRSLDQLLVDLLLLGDTQAVRHLDDADAVDESLVVLVGLEALPLRFIGVREDDAGERYGADVLGADIVAFLRRGQQRMQHLDRRLEHLDEFENALVGAVETAGIAVGIRIVLRESFQLADVDLANQRGDVLIILVAGFGLRDRDLAQARGLDARDAELRDIAAEGFKPLVAPRAHQAVETTARNAVLLLDHRPKRLGIEQAQRRLEHRAQFVAGLQHVDRVHFH